MTKFAIKSKDNGTYFTGAAFIGPKFGGGPNDAIKFDDRLAAADAARGFPRVVLFDVVEVYTAPCGDCENPMWVEQVPLLPEATMTRCPGAAVSREPCKGWRANAASNAYVLDLGPVTSVAYPCIGTWFWRIVRGRADDELWYDKCGLVDEYRGHVEGYGGHGALAAKLAAEDAARKLLTEALAVLDGTVTT